MTDHPFQISQRKAAIVAAIGLVLSLLGVAIGISMGASLELIIPGDEAATVNHILEAGWLFRVGIFGWLVVILGDVVRAWALYVFFKKLNPNLSLLAVFCMLLHDAIFGAALVCLVLVSELVTGAGAFAGMAPEQAHPLMTLLLKGHFYGFEFGLFFFSFHLLILGMLVFQSRYIPKILGIMLVIAFVGYFVDSVGIITFPAYPKILTSILAVPNFIGEVAFITWLAIKGRSVIL